MTARSNRPEPRDLPPPLGNTREDRINNIAAWWQELVVLDNVEPADAARKAIDAAMPSETEAISPATRILAWVLVAMFAAAVLAVAIPAVLWVVGNGIIPMWHWGTRWMP